MFDVHCGEKSLTIHSDKCNIRTSGPGTICIGRGDLYDWGFTHEEIHAEGGVTLQCSMSAKLRFEVYPKTIFQKVTGVIREKDDCGVIMVAAVGEVPYHTAARILRGQGRIDGDGVTDRQWKAALEILGCRLRRIKQTGRTIRTVARSLPLTGRYVLVTTDHVVGLVNGELVDDVEKWGDLLRVSHVFHVDFV